MVASYPQNPLTLPASVCFLRSNELANQRPCIKSSQVRIKVEKAGQQQSSLKRIIGLGSEKPAPRCGLGDLSIEGVEKREACFRAVQKRGPPKRIPYPCRRSCFEHELNSPPSAA